MKQSLKQIFVSQTVLLASLFLTSCGPSSNANNYSHQYQIPWRGDDGTYKLQAVTIDSLSDPANLSGSIVQLFITPTENGGHLDGPPAVGRFMTRKDGVHVPLDFVSLQGASINAHFEKIHDFDHAVGVDSLLSWPLQISIETDVAGSGDEKINNAFYDGNRNAILILPYTDNSKEGLPLSLNGGVLAHEHFHAVFFKLVMKPLKLAGQSVETKISELVAPRVTISDDIKKVGTDEPRANAKDFNEFILRAANEGLADFWSWLALGDDKFVGRSLTAYNECRRLDTPFTSLPSSAELKDNVLNVRDEEHPEKVDQNRLFMAYQVGSQYARFLRELSLAAYGEKLGFVDRVEIGQAIVRALGGYSEATVSQYATAEIPSDSIIDLIANSFPAGRMNEKACGVLAAFKQSGAAMPDSCSKFKIKPEDLAKAKSLRVDHKPKINHCACEEEGENKCD